MLNGMRLDGFPAKFSSLRRHCLLVGEEPQAPAPITAIRMIKTTKIWPDEFDREFIFKFFILAGEAKTNAFDHLTVTNERAMSLFASVSPKRFPGIRTLNGPSNRRDAHLIPKLPVRFLGPFHPRARRIKSVVFQAISSRFLCNWADNVRNAPHQPGWVSRA